MQYDAIVTDNAVQYGCTYIVHTYLSLSKAKTHILVKENGSGHQQERAVSQVQVGTHLAVQLRQYFIPEQIAVIRSIDHQSLILRDDPCSIFIVVRVFQDSEFTNNHSTSLINFIHM